MEPSLKLEPRDELSLVHQFRQYLDKDRENVKSTRELIKQTNDHRKMVNKWLKAVGVSHKTPWVVYFGEFNRRQN